MAWKIVVALLCVGTICAAQSDERKSELFISHKGGTTLPAKAYIPAKTCAAIIKQADGIVVSNKLNKLAKSDLQVASLNLRTLCDI